MDGPLNLREQSGQKPAAHFLTRFWLRGFTSSSSKQWDGEEYANKHKEKLSETFLSCALDRQKFGANRTNQVNPTARLECRGVPRIIFQNGHLGQ